MKPTYAPTAAPAGSRGPDPTPAPTPAPEAGTPTGVISPLQVEDPAALASELSESELECFGDDPGNLAQALTGGAPATREKQAELLNCLEDETVARMFLAGFVSSPRPLS